MQSKHYLFTAIAATISAIFNTQSSYAVSIIYEEDIESNINDKVTYRLGMGIGLISTLASPEPWRSLFGQEQMGDGLLYTFLRRSRISS